EMHPRQYRVVEQRRETVDLRAESQFEDRGEVLAQRRAVMLTRHIDEARDEALERVAARKERDALAILQAEDAERDVVELILGNLEQLVARIGLEDMRQRLAVMAVRIEAAAPQHAGDFEAQERYRAGRAAVSERRIEA